jgi:hypothetical protein
VQSPCRSFTEFEYLTLKSWTKARRVLRKAEILPQGDNPRFICHQPAQGRLGRIQLKWRDSNRLLCTKCFIALAVT